MPMGLLYAVGPAESILCWSKNHVQVEGREGWVKYITCHIKIVKVRFISLVRVVFVVLDAMVRKRAKRRKWFVVQQKLWEITSAFYLSSTNEAKTWLIRIKIRFLHCLPFALPQCHEAGYSIYGQRLNWSFLSPGEQSHCSPSSRPPCPLPPSMS